MDLAPIEKQETNLLSIIGQAALDPHVDVEKMRALLELKERIDEGESKKIFHAAMIAAQEDMKPVLRNCENKESHSRYANLEAIDRAIRPVYTRHGFVLSFNSKEGRDGMITMSCSCMHKGGYAKDYELAGHLDGTGIKGTHNKTGIMAAGSTVSYLRRYLTCMIFNIVLTNEDDDGQGTVELITGAQKGAILDLLNTGSIPERAFLKSANIGAIEDLPAHRYEAAIAAIKAKIAAKQ